MSIELVRTKDILAELGNGKNIISRRVCSRTDNLEEYAQKIKRENADILWQTM